MEKEIVEFICSKYNINKKTIKVLIKICKYYNIYDDKNITKYIRKFYT